MPTFLTELTPPDVQVPWPGMRVRWPGDDREWVWDGREWVGERTAFDGGDAWIEPDEGQAA